MKKKRNAKNTTETVSTTGTSFVHTDNFSILPVKETRSEKMKNFFGTLLITGATLFFVDVVVAEVLYNTGFLLPDFFRYLLVGYSTYRVSKILLDE